MANIQPLNLKHYAEELSVMATSAADAKKRVDAGEGDIAADVFDEWADKARIQR